MENEKSAAQLQAEKDAYGPDRIGIDESGHSEILIDVKLNQAMSNPQSVQSIGIFKSKKIEKVLLEKK